MKFTPTHRHKTRGSAYMLTGAAILQTARPLADNEVMMVYESEDGRLYVRPRDEFYDGRFETMLLAEIEKDHDT